MRIVLDTNVLISAFVFPGGAPERVYRRVMEGELTLVTSRPLLSELGRILTTKFGWDPSYGEEVVAQIVRIAELVEPNEEVADIKDDPADNRVLEAAAAGGANVIVSGDRHLRQLVTWRSIRVLEPAQFLTELRST